MLVNSTTNPATLVSHRATGHPREDAKGCGSEANEQPHLDQHAVRSRER
jgi:hypothetical protein